MECSGGGGRGRDDSLSGESQAHGRGSSPLPLIFKKILQTMTCCTSDESVASVVATEGSPSEQDGQQEQDYNSLNSKIMRYPEPTLPEDILYHIHSLLPLRDAARAACVSHAFLNSWRCRPNLYFNTKALGLKANCETATSREFTKIVDHILKKHSDIGLKTFQLATYGCYYIGSCHLDSWLHLVLTLGIEELILSTNSLGPKYNFPLSLLCKSGNSIRYLRLNSCTFRPTVRLGCFKSLKKLHLYCVGISGDELGCLLPDSVALEQLKLAYCNEIICLKIPHVLQRLSCLDVAACHNLQVIKSEAPNLSSVCFEWFHRNVHVSLGEALHVKKLQMLCFRDFYYAHLPSIMPNLESLTIDSSCQIASIPSVHNKFCQLKYLNICVPGETNGPVYDFLSLASFLGASPCLETFILRIHVPEVRVKYGLFSEDPSHLRQIPEHRCVKLKHAKIIGFYPAKSLLELASHVLETAISLECLTLDTTYCLRRHINPARCYLVAIKRYFEGKVPSTARLDVEGPCSGVRLNDHRWQGVTVFDGRS